MTSLVRSRLPARMHMVAGIAAIFIIGAFQVATIGVELLGTMEQVAAIKRGIWLAIPALVLAMAMAGGSGNWLARGNGSTLVKRKRRRMLIAAANGLLVLIPSAYLLQRWAGEGAITTEFYALQALELAAGWVNLALLIRNAVEGRKLARRGMSTTQVRAA